MGKKKTETKDQTKIIAMRKSDQRIITKSYGEDVAKYLNTNNIMSQIKKTRSGMYKLPSISHLHNCSKLAITAKKRIMAKQKIEEETPRPQKVAIRQDCFDLPDNFRRIINHSTDIKSKTWEAQSCTAQTYSSNKPASVATNMFVCFQNKYQLRGKNCALCFSPSKGERTAKRWNCQKLFDHIMQTKIGYESKIGHEDCSEAIMPILREFQCNHEKFSYHQLLEADLKITNSSDKYSPHVSPNSLQRYFYRIFACVVPRSLFGSHRNDKLLRASLGQYFLAFLGKPICLKKSVASLDLSCVAWLRPIKNQETKWSVIAKMAKWLFEVYFAGILKTVFMIQKHLYSHRKIFLSRERWRKQRKWYIETQEKKGYIAKSNLENDGPEGDRVPVASLSLYAKRSGVRPVYRIKYDNRNLSEIRMLRTLLQQLYTLHYKSVPKQQLHSLLLKTAKQKEVDAKCKVYLVSADVRDAYGSVIQNKLYNILAKMINDKCCQTLTWKSCAVLKPNVTWRQNAVEYKCWFEGCGECPGIAKKSLITENINSKEQNSNQQGSISKELVLSTLKKHISQQTFRLGRTLYILKNGVAQGSPLAPILSDMYYAHMTVNEFADLKESGTLLRFMDDFLYISEDKESAEEYISRTRRGIPLYNCQFNLSKTQTNVELKFLETSPSIPYLGYSIDSTSLDVTPLYEDLSFRYFKPMQKVFLKGHMEVFIYRIMNFTALKLVPVVLDSRINDPATIKSTAKSAAHLLALRCAVLIPTVFDHVDHHIPDIMKAISDAVRKLLVPFKLHLHGYKNERRWAFIRSLQFSIWKTFLRVFSQKNQLRLYFCRDIRYMVNKYWSVS